MKLSIEKAIYGGLGLARIDGKTVFVPRALPGEEVEAHITEEKRSFANAEIDTVLSVSPARVAPECPYFERCGGCHYQHCSYSEQLQLKREVLAETLRRSGVKEFPEIEVLAGEPWRYRNRVRLLVQAGKDTTLAYRGWKSHQAVSVNVCPVAAPVLERAIQQVQSIADELNLASWAKELEFFCNDSEEQVLLCVTTTGKLQKGQLRALHEAVENGLPALLGSAAFAGGKEGEPDLRGPLMERYGQSALRYSAGGRSYQVTAGAFFQVNRFLVDALVRLVTGGRKGTLAWDLYAGVGLFAQALSESYDKVVAVEVAPISSKDLAKNLPPQQAFVKLSTLDFLRQSKSVAQRPDLIVVDPPRAGLGKDVTALLTKVHGQELVYVSCDPATFGRDLSVLIAGGYRFKSLHLVDLFPQTFHLESVAQLEWVG